MSERFRLIQDNCLLIKSGRYTLVEGVDKCIIQARSGLSVKNPKDMRFQIAAEKDAILEAERDENKYCAKCPVYKKCLPTPTAYGNDINTPVIIYPALNSSYPGPRQTRPVQVGIKT